MEAYHNDNEELKQPKYNWLFQTEYQSSEYSQHEQSDHKLDTDDSESEANVYLQCSTQLPLVIHTPKYQHQKAHFITDGMIDTYSCYGSARYHSFLY